MARRSDEALRELWRLGLRVSQLLASVASLIPQALSAMVRTVEETLRFGSRISESTLATVGLPALSPGPRPSVPAVGKHGEAPAQPPALTFLLNVTLARRTAAELARRLVARSPQPAFAELQTAEPVGRALTDLERISEAARAPGTPMALPGTGRYAAHARPPSRHLVALRQPETTAELEPPSSLALGALTLLPLAQLQSISAQLAQIAGEAQRMAWDFRPVLPMLSPAPEAPPQAQAKAEAAVTLAQVPLPPQLSAAEFPPTAEIGAVLPVVSISGFRLRLEAAEPVRTAARLPIVTLAPWLPLVGTTTAPPAPPHAHPSALTATLLAAPAASVLLLPPGVSPAGEETRPPRPLEGPPVTLHLMGFPSRLAASLSARYLTPLLGYLRYAAPPWYPAVARVALPAEPAWFSAAQRLAGMAYALLPLGRLSAQRPDLSWALPMPRLEAAVWPMGAIWTMPSPAAVSLVAQPSQVYPAFSLALGTIAGVAQFAKAWEPRLGETPSLASVSWEVSRGLPAVSPVVPGPVWPRLGPLLSGIASTAFRHAALAEMHVIQSSYGEALTELGGFTAVRETTIAVMPPLGYGALRAVEPYAPPAQPSMPSPAAPRLPLPTIQNTINLTVSAESEEDLRELERKIARILAEQMRRYYGSESIRGG